MSLDWTALIRRITRAQGITIGVEPICSVLPIAPSPYYSHLVKRADPARQFDRARREDALRPKILRVFEENDPVYGVRKGEPLTATLVRAQLRTASCAAKAS